MQINKSANHRITTRQAFNWAKLDSTDIRAHLIKSGITLSPLTLMVSAMQDAMVAGGQRYSEPSISIKNGSDPMLLIVCKIDCDRKTAARINRMYSQLTHLLPLSALEHNTIIITAVSTLH